MANTKVTGDLIADATITATNIADGAVTAAKLTGITTTSIAEGDKLFYTDARVGTYLSTNGYDTAANIIATITDSAPATLDTLNELAAALGDDPNYATTTANLIGTKLPLAGGTLTGALSFQDTSIPSAGTARIFSRDTNSYLYLQTGSGNQIQLLDGSQNTMALFNSNLISFSIANSPAMTIDSSGRVGIGVVPSTIWSASYDALQIGLGGSIYAHSSAGNALKLGSNIVYEGTAPNYYDKYLTSSTATKYEQDAGSHIWSVAASGTAGNNVSWSEAMRISSSGNIGINETNPTSKLTIKGANYVITDSGQAIGGIDIRTTSSPGSGGYGGAISFAANGTGRAAISAVQGTSDNDNQGLAFFTHGSTSSSDSIERMRIDSSGNVGIGTGSPSQKLTIVENGFGLRVQQSTDATQYSVLSGNQLQAYQSGAGGNLYLNYSSGGNIIIGIGSVGVGTTSPSGKLQVNNTGTQILRYTTSANLELYEPEGQTGYVRLGAAYLKKGIYSSSDLNLWAEGSNPIVFYAGGGGNSSEKMRILPGGGITFNGDTAAANALDDYEEGTWTPTISHNDGTGVIPLTVNSAKYVKVGSLVYLSCYLTNINPAGNAGTSSPYYGIRGFPFPPDTYGAWQIVYASSTVSSYGGYSAPESLYFMNNGSNGQRSSVHLSGSDVNSWGAGISLMMNAVYRIA